MIGQSAEVTMERAEPASVELKLVVLSFSFARGGAGLAAQKFARLAQAFAAVDCYCAEPSAVPDDVLVNGPGWWDYRVHFTKRVLSWALAQLMRDGNPVKHSLNLFSSPNALRAVEAALADDAVLHLHWINNDTLGVRRFRDLPQGSIITLHDEWFFCGSEHYYPVAACGGEKFSQGYPLHDGGVRGVNWNRILWNAKVRQFARRNDLIFTVPSEWMLARAQRSKILGGKKVRLLPNPIETQRFTPLGATERSAARAAASIPKGAVVLAVGAVKGQKNPMKGFSVLEEALSTLRRSLTPELRARLHLVLFGSGRPGAGEHLGFSATHLGKLDGLDELRRTYGMADFTVVPSFVESFGQVAAESLACATPVVAFRTSGLLDIVQHETNGFLAQPFEADSLAQCIARMLELPAEHRRRLGEAGREHVIEHFSPPVVADAYERIVREAIALRSRPPSKHKQAD
jgi:glycosyltransferase involved in cell wall biosynthesis